jgi:hypothetical protein
MLLNKLKKRISLLIESVTKETIAVRRQCYEQLKINKRINSPLALSGYGYKVFSQSDEDGIIKEIFNRIGCKSKIFVEFGVGDGLENNTAALLYEGWKGLWIEGSRDYCSVINKTYKKAIETQQLHIINSFITPKNINELIQKRIEVEEIDLLSVDIDGNDVHVYEQIKCIKPRVVVFEYNAKFGPSIDYCMSYDEKYIWKKSDRFGASLKHFEKIMYNHGYKLVGCNIVGTNSFFVRVDLTSNKFEEEGTSEHHFEPARYELVGIPSGHQCSDETFGTKVG